MCIIYCLIEGTRQARSMESLKDVERQQDLERSLIEVSVVEAAAARDGKGGVVVVKKHWSQKTVVPYVVLALLQFTYAGYQILTRVALVHGIDPLLFTFYRNLIAALFLAPGAILYERNVRPKMRLSTLGTLNLLAFFGVLGNQQLFVVGLKLTSPLFAAVSQNTIPVITFLLAAVIGLEEITVRKTSGLAKILGTAICISGAVTMTLYKGVAIFSRAAEPERGLGFVHLFKHVGIPALVHIKIGQWAVGALCLLLNCTSWGFYLIIQGSVMRKYPAVLSMGCMVEFFGAMQASVLGFAMEGTAFLDVRTITMNHLTCILYAGIVSSAINLVVQAWCIQQVGPFINSLYTPVQALVVAFLAILLLGETLYVGILVGAILIIGGFYIVYYGQRLERRQKRAEAEGLDTKLQSDLKEPLLS